LQCAEGTHATLEQAKERFMTRRISAIAVASIAALGVAGVATAASSHSAKVFKASLTAVNPAATTAGLADVVGKAQLVDGKKNNKVSLHMRNLAADTVYLWHVHEGSCAATGAPLAGWTYRTQDAAGNGTFTSNASGNGNTKGKSATFNADPTKSYSVNVHVSTPTNGLPAGTIIACGDLNPSKASGKSKSKSNKPHPAQAKGPKT
jgi:Cu/Zn superoxide dismutase